MLIPLVAHTGQVLAPHDLWSAWNPDPLLLSGLLGAGLLYRHGRTPGPHRALLRWRRRCFWTGLATLVVALVSPLEALAGALASAHMVQHILLLLVAAPLLAFSAPSSALLRGTPLALRRGGLGWRRRWRLTPDRVRAVQHPVGVVVAHVVVLWMWHSAALYDAAVANELLHIVEHATFLGTGLLFWHIVIGARRQPHLVSPGLGVLLVFVTAMSSVLLSALLTFSPTPWYASYTTTAPAWGLDALADQQLAGAIMWVPAGFIHLGVALTLLATWIRTTERQAATL